MKLKKACKTSYNNYTLVAVRMKNEIYVRTLFSSHFVNRVQGHIRMDVTYLKKASL